MSKKVLIVYYTQSGQLEEIVEKFSVSFVASGVTVEQVKIKPKKDFSFPWTSDSFFQTMPESVLGIPVALEDFRFKEASYDLVVFAYQPWFLSPSIPAVSLLSHPEFKKVIKNTPVLTLIGARNMWLNAQEKVKIKLAEAEANLVGNIALIDKNGNLASAVSILYWMLTGKKERYMGIFPKPGVSEGDIQNAERFGDITKEALLEGKWNDLQQKLVLAKALEVAPDLMFIESRAKRLFSIWANITIKKKNRSLWAKFFKYYLLVALFMVAPVVVKINGIVIQPFLKKRITRKKNYYLGLNS